jgi:uncharacterized protein (DUF2252 family)
VRQMRLDAARGIVREPPKLLAVEMRPAAALAAATGRALHTYRWEDVGARVLVTVPLQGLAPVLNRNLASLAAERYDNTHASQQDDDPYNKWGLKSLSDVAIRMDPQHAVSPSTWNEDHAPPRIRG